VQIATPQRTPAEELIAHGLRATRQRVAVLEVLRGTTRHPTANEIYRKVLEELPGISLKTVYDVLEALVAAGIAGSVSDGGAAQRYDGNNDPHYHAQCRRCGSMLDLPATANGQIRGRTPLPSGFELEDIRVTLVGLCEDCRDAS